MNLSQPQPARELDPLSGLWDEGQDASLTHSCDLNSVTMGATYAFLGYESSSVRLFNSIVRCFRNILRECFRYISATGREWMEM